MSKVRINDLARELEVKSRQILDVLMELGLAAGKTHSSSLEEDEAEQVRARFNHGAGRTSGHGAGSGSRAPQAIAPKFDFSHISKPGDAARAILAKKQEAEAESHRPHLPVRPAPPAAPKIEAKPVAPPPVAAAPPAPPARPEP